MPKINFNEGFSYITLYSQKFRRLIQSIAESAESHLPDGKLNGIGVFLFGSPSRQEMIDESDADIIIIRKEDNSEYNLFKKNFIKLLEKENFSKIDLPDWGTFEDCENYIKYSITEGNQVTEAKFVYGDESTLDFLNKLREKYCNTDRLQKVMCFQKLYFDQYYKQKTLEGIRNVKYGHGGTRDFMFVTWLVNLIDSLENRKINLEDNFPLVYKSLSQLYERKIIGFIDYKNYLKSLDIVAILRNEILKQNKFTEYEGLTYLDDNTVSLLAKRKVFDEYFEGKELKRFLEYHLDNVFKLKTACWKEFLHIIYNIKGEEWSETMQKILNKEIDYNVLNYIKEDDFIMQMVLIWNLEKSKSPLIFENTFNKYKDSLEWCILASLACHHECPDDVLSHIVKKASSKGYEYILRIISRNRNVSRETLSKIIDNPNLENRYKIVAKTSYDKGVMKANEFQ